MGMSWNMTKSEIKEKDSQNPTVDRSIWLYIGIVDHTLYILSIDLDNQVLNTNNPYLTILQCTKKTKELEFCL